MSLLNDALKRARDAQGNLPTPPTTTIFHPPARTRDGMGWILPVAIALFLGAAGIFLFLAFGAHKSGVKMPSTVAAVEPGKVSATPEPKLLPVIAPVPAPKTNPPVLATEPLPKVQAILLTSQPQAIVDGKVVGIGGSAGDFLVKKIEKGAVTFQRRNGSQTTLQLGK